MIEYYEIIPTKIIILKKLNIRKVWLDCIKKYCKVENNINNKVFLLEK